MQKGISIIYANRNRDLTRIKASLDSLQNQGRDDFEVVFVDYGSRRELVTAYENLLVSYDFVQFYPLQVSHLLWNKSKALNYGIQKSSFSYIFIADVDLVFHPEAISLFERIKAPEKFFLFQLGYLDGKESNKLEFEYAFEDLKPRRTGQVNGMVLASKNAFIEVGGLDDFFHFYGAEDEDLFARLKIRGYQEERNNSPYFYHNWHPSFSGSEDRLITVEPRVRNIMRINEQHFFRNRAKGVFKPHDLAESADVENKTFEILKKPSVSVTVSNIRASVEHFLGEELPSYEGEVVRVEFIEDPYFKSFKYFLKNKLGKQTQPYISLKGVNDMVLKEIVFRYRNHNYSFEIGESLNKITLRIQM